MSGVKLSWTIFKPLQLLIAHLCVWPTIQWLLNKSFLNLTETTGFHQSKGWESHEVASEAYSADFPASLELVCLMFPSIYFVAVIFWDRASGSPGWPLICYIAKDDLEPWPSYVCLYRSRSMPPCPGKHWSSATTLEMQQAWQKQHLCWVWQSDYWNNEPQKNENVPKNLTLGERKKLPPEGELETDSNNLSEHLRGWNRQKDGMTGQRWWDSLGGHILDPLTRLRSHFRTPKMDLGVPWIFSSYPLKGPH